MTFREIRKRIDAVDSALQSAARAQAAGKLEEAALRHVEAQRLLESLIGDDPEAPRHHQALGSSLYALGEIELARGLPMRAVEVLERAEVAYRSLRDFDEQALAWIAELPHHQIAADSPHGTIAGWMADVCLRRARAHVAVGSEASALVDAQAAVVAYLDRWSGVSSDRVALDVARVCSWAAWVTIHAGDPDLACAAADTAIRIYVARAADINAAPVLLAQHGRTFVLATRLAANIHRADGRLSIAAEAAKMAESAGRVGGTEIPSPAPVPSTEAIAARPTLAQALDDAGAKELRSEVVAAPTDCRLRVPLDRAPGAEKLRGLQLAAVAIGMMNDKPELALRIALEAHAMLAGASLRPSGIRWTPGDDDAPWVTMLHRSAEASERLGRRPLARDWSQWLTGCIGSRLPHAIVSSSLHKAIRDALEWQRDFFLSVGDEQSARSCAKIVESMKHAGLA
jgi:tetratricopeptide (TPR) repeat protein